MSLSAGELTAVGVPALISIGSAVYASIEARRARQSEREAERLRVLESRVSQHKYDVYFPIIEAFSRLLRGKAPEDLDVIMDRFSAWHLIYGSDNAVTAYGQLMQTIYAQPHTEIVVRMYAEFFIAARRDLADNETRLTELAVMESRINDLYTDRNYFAAISMPRNELFSKHSWIPPWEITDPPQQLMNTASTTNPEGSS